MLVDRNNPRVCLARFTAAFATEHHLSAVALAPAKVKNGECRLTRSLQFWRTTNEFMSSLMDSEPAREKAAYLVNTTCRSPMELARALVALDAETTGSIGIGASLLRAKFDLLFSAPRATVHHPRSRLRLSLHAKTTRQAPLDRRCDNRGRHKSKRQRHADRTVGFSLTGGKRLEGGPIGVTPCDPHHESTC
jgi:hypothetical protein